jgi:hypothetical protein
MGVLEDKAQQAIDDDLLKQKAEEAVAEANYEKDVKEYIKERWPDIKLWEKRFIIELMKGGKPLYKCYQDALGNGVKESSAKNGATRILKKLNIPFSELLDYTGHGEDTMIEALDDMREEDVDKYLKHITKLKQLEVQHVELNGSISMPVINIVTEVKEG